jgi:signal peptidase I
MARNLTSLWREWRSFLLFVAVMLLFRSAIADWNQVPSGSMIPSILIGDRIVVDKLAYNLRVPFTMRSLMRWGEPQRGDVVTFNSPADERLLVKRVIGVPGDYVELQDNRLIVNDVAAHYEQVDERKLDALGFVGHVHYEVYRESLLGNTRYVMLQRMPHPGITTSFAPTRVPEGHYLMMGDNRDNSSDSRRIGFVSRDRILGRANSIAFSLDYENYYAPRMDRFFEDLH